MEPPSDSAAGDAIVFFDQHVLGNTKSFLITLSLRKISMCLLASESDNSVNYHKNFVRAELCLIFGKKK